MTPDRELEDSGFYWVKSAINGQWLVAQWCATFGDWFLAGDEGGFQSDEWQAVVGPLKPPIETEAA